MDELSRAIAKSQAKAKAPKKKRARNTDPRKVTAAGSQQRAQIQASVAALNERTAQIERRYENKRQRTAGRYQTKAAITEKVRAEIAAGKLPKGSLQRTVDRRWKATQQRRAKALEALQAKKISEIAKVRADLKERPPVVRMQAVRAFITYQWSDDIKTVTLQFQTSDGNFYEDSYDALLAYTMDNSVEMISTELLEVLE